MPLRSSSAPAVRATTTIASAARAVEHRDLLAAQAEAVAARLGARRDAVQVEAAAALLLREREERVAAHDAARASAVFCASLPRELEHLAREQHRGEERLGREVAAELLEHDRELGEPMPAPPSDSGNGMPTQPSSAICFQSAREKPSGSFASRSARTRATGELLRHEVGGGLREELLVFGEHELHGRSLLRLVRQAEHALGDDVELDLGRAALDRVAARAQPVRA